MSGAEYGPTKYPAKSGAAKPGAFSVRRFFLSVSQIGVFYCEKCLHFSFHCAIICVLQMKKRLLPRGCTRGEKGVRG